MSTPRLLTFTTLYPNSAQPQHGVFVETRLRHLLEAKALPVRVVAPVPWFPFASSRFGRYGRYAKIPKCETRHGIEIVHPRYPVVPKIGMPVTPFLLAASATRAVQQIVNDGYRFDVLDAHYFYPDGVAAALMAQRFHKPLVITARGTDINLIPRYALPRRMIRWAADRASAIITVCHALKEELVDLGVADEKISVLRNGVDLEFFRPGDRARQRRDLGLVRTTLLSVGHLIERKGHDIAIRALVRLPDVELLIVGEGEQERSLRELSASVGVADRVRFVGAISQRKLADYYGAADALVLASSREGWANVLLESMACGTPVIASDVWGTPEVVAAPEAGALMSVRDVDGLIEAYRRLFRDYPERSATRRYAERFSWHDTTHGLLRVFESVLR